MKYRIKEKHNKYVDTIYIPQKRYKYIPMWFNFYQNLHNAQYKVLFSSKKSAEMWLKRTLGK